MPFKPLFVLGLFAAALAQPAHAALKVGSPAPDFRAPAYLAGKAFTFKLSEALKKGPVVVYFFPAAYTPGCNIEAHLFSKAIDDFRKAGASVIGAVKVNVPLLSTVQVPWPSTVRVVPSPTSIGPVPSSAYESATGVCERCREVA